MIKVSALNEVVSGSIKSVFRAWEQRLNSSELYMERHESLLKTPRDEENLDDGYDVEMLDAEEGELIEQISKASIGECSNIDDIQEKQESNRQDSRQKKKKKRKKNKRTKGESVDPNLTNINRFVLDACKRLRERKSYLMYTAVGCLGVAALSDLINEVDAIQACGGQLTADGRRLRFGGGILWNIIKVRDPNAYKEIMRKGKEFEKQFRQQKQGPLRPTENSSKSSPLDANQVSSNPSHDVELTPRDEIQHNVSTAGEKRTSVHNRIRIPVTYDDDLLGGKDYEDNSARLQ